MEKIDNAGYDKNTPKGNHSKEKKNDAVKDKKDKHFKKKDNGVKKEDNKKADLAKKEQNVEVFKAKNDFDSTIFIQNINYTSNDNDLYQYFKSFGGVVYAKIVKNQDGSSKGNGFVRFSKESTCKEVLELANKYVGSENQFESPFELHGKYLKIYPAMNRKQAPVAVKEIDKRNERNLLFGLNSKVEGEVTEIDKEKREYFVNIKKEDFEKNPNLFVSNKRIRVRNLAKNITIDMLKEKVLSISKAFFDLPQNKELKAQADKIKIIEQIKLINNKDTGKSKVMFYI